MKNLTKEDIKILASYKKISSFINYLKDYEIPYKVLELNDSHMRSDGSIVIKINFDLMDCNFETTPSNIKAFNVILREYLNQK